MRRPLLAALLAGVAIPAVAEVRDHIQTDPCSAMARTTVVGVVGHPVTIKMPPGEWVYRVIQPLKLQADGKFGDNSPWQRITAQCENDDKDCKAGVAKAESQPENVFPLYPALVGTAELTIITTTQTDANQTEPAVKVVHNFRTITRPDEADNADASDVAQTLICTGVAARPAPVVVQMVTQQAVVKKRTDDAAVKDRLRQETALTASMENCHYTAQGKHGTAIEPRCPIDNGQWTWIRFPGLSKKPAVFAVNSAGEERTAPQHIEGDFIVVEEIDQHLRLRLWPDVLDLINDKYDPVGKDPGTRTTVPGVGLEIIQASKRP